MAIPGRGQNNPQPVAKFSFNNGIDYDEVSRNKVKLVGITPAEDRFGNPNHAVFISGNADSYINLGTSKTLKPKTGSISLWVAVDGPVWSGRGAYFDPIILTKSTELNDFYEAYSIYYELMTKKFAAVISKDSTNQIVLCSNKEIEPNTWYHMVITYDNTSASLYLDGDLQIRFPKNFETRFLATDSVLMGYTGNKKNERFLKGNIDDIEFYDRVLTPDEVKELFHAPNPNKNKVILYAIIAFLAFICIVLSLYFLIRFQIRKGIRKEKEKLGLRSKLLETELRVNRASMNPHFLFNSLNVLHELILNNEVEHASDYLIKFSTLIRKILDSNMYESIPLNLEIELLERYLEIENLRFIENIKYTITVKDPLVPSVVKVPIMMLQPFIENAIWHGLLNIEGEKRIDIFFSLYKEKYICCIIEDNGKGRREKNPDNVDKKSLAIGFIQQRLDLLNQLHHTECDLQIEDKPNSSGTIVRIILPVLYK